MGMKTTDRNKGFTLLELLVAGIILTMVGAGLAGVYVIEYAMMMQTAHRLTAVNYATSVADSLIEIGEPQDWRWGLGEATYPPELSLGEHTEATDPSLCTLPPGPFKDTLSGSLKYQVWNRVIAGATGRLVRVTVSWTEQFPKVAEKEEILYFTAFWING